LKSLLQRRGVVISIRKLTGTARTTAHFPRPRFSIVIAALAFSLFCTEREGDGSAIQGGRLVRATAQFITTDDDKDNDTSVSILVRRDNGEIVARADGITGYFSNGTSSKEFIVKIVSASYRGQVLNGNTTVTISPNGHDTWKFNYKIVLKFDDNTTLERYYPGVVLSEGAKERTFSLYTTKSSKGGSL
jgi:hypothetical protein